MVVEELLLWRLQLKGLHDVLHDPDNLVVLR
jgi:hypothetical protein